jgi:hypothetical protein
LSLSCDIAWSVVGSDEGVSITCSDRMGNG